MNINNLNRLSMINRWDPQLLQFQEYPPARPVAANKLANVPEKAEDVIPAIRKYFLDSIFSTALGVIGNFHLVRNQKSAILNIYTNIKLTVPSFPFHNSFHI